MSGQLTRPDTQEDSLMEWDESGFYCGEAHALGWMQPETSWHKTYRVVGNGVCA